MGRDYEIIGRDIRLADILLAMGETDYIFAVNKKSELWAMTYDGNGYGKSQSFWNLLKDNLADQSEECINFIHGVLIKNK